MRFPRAIRPVHIAGATPAAAVALLMLLPAVCAAQYPRVETKAEPTRATVGERIRLTVTVTAPEMGALTFVEPFEKDSQSTWSLIAKESEPDRKLNATEWERKVHYVIAPFATGEVPVPAIEILYKPSGGGERTRRTEEIAVTVDSLLPSTTAKLDPKDIKPPVTVPYPRWALVAAGVAVVAALAWICLAAWRRLRRRIQAIVHPPKPLDDWAIEQLQVLEQERLIEQRKVKEFYTRMADTLRVYVGRLFGVDALDMTTWELSECLADRMTEKEKERTVGLFDLADLVKFAKHSPDALACRESLDQARDVVNMTRYYIRRQEEMAGTDSILPETPGAAADRQPANREAAS